PPHSPITTSCLHTLRRKIHVRTPYLTLIAISYLYSAFGNLINGQGKTQVTLKLTLITSAIGFPLSIPLIPKLES
ncbi:MAG: hypothetical protein NWE85_04745, partial [Candidatus Bathyarchaeota archaeon]|nr:hypothetical protein [Candidatus Bathyarchaeota archaeon]